MNNKPTVVLFRGFPGVGKTYLSSLLAEENKYAIIRKDDIYDTIYSSIESHKERNKICYGLLHKLLDTNLKSGANLIIDCPFRDHKDLDVLSEFIEARNGKFKPILCECRNELLWKERFNSREVAPNNIIRSFEVLKKHYGNMLLERYKEELVLDTQYPIEDLRIKIRTYISNNL